MQVTHFGAFDSSAALDVAGSNPQMFVPGQIQLTVNGPISVGAAPVGLVPGAFEITKAGVCALTLAAPVSGLDDGKCIWVFSSTAFAHTITATGLYQSGSAAVNLATFAAFAGAGICLMAFGGKWRIVYSVGVTMS